MSCWSHDLTLQIVELKARRRQLSVTDPRAVHFASHGDFSKRSQGRHAYWLLTNTWQNTWELFKDLVWEEIKCLHAWLGHSQYLCLPCRLLPPSAWLKGLLHAYCCLWLQPLTGSQDLCTFSQRVSELAWSGSTRGAFFSTLEVQAKGLFAVKAWCASKQSTTE